MFFSNLFGDWQGALFAIISLLVALSIHEFGHALAATWLGDPTAKSEGRLTLNPLSHIDPFGLLFILLAGFGWGKPVPYNPDNFARRSDELVVALSGPGMNFLLAFLLGLVYRAVISRSVGSVDTTWLIVVNSLISWNILLLAFNLIPIPPLDGSKIISYFLNYEQRLYFEQIGVPILFGLLLLQAGFGIPVFTRILDPLLQLFGFLTRSLPGGFN
ncbi:site-2 protease family protein [Candidatus Berkelbacteria bacterium]|nr:site-2 protease family protein [Candidatus Berkelbacteria bacterium]